MEDLPITEKQIVIVNNIQPPIGHPPKSVAIYGDIDEETSSSVVESLIYSADAVAAYHDDVEVSPEIDLYISTYGGSILDMFAVYDVMRMVKKSLTIRTFGVGKVMSAGVLLLASGTKGQRHIGKNCRIMLHSAAAGISGPVFNMVNEMGEVVRLQRQYINCLAKQTNLSKKRIKKLISKRVDVYFSAKEAVKFGIADKIV